MALNPGARLGPDEVTVEIYGVEQGPAEAGHYVRALVMEYGGHGETQRAGGV
jgi:hypothetical protein